METLKTGPPDLTIPETVYIVSNDGGKTKHYLTNPNEPLYSGFRWVKNHYEYFVNNTVPAHTRFARTRYQNWLKTWAEQGQIKNVINLVTA